MRGPASILPILLLVCACKPTTPANPAAARADGPRDVTIDPGGVAEECIEADPGRRVTYGYAASSPIDFNIHRHEGEAVLFTSRLDSTGRAVGLFTPEVAQTYCLMWTNGTDRPVTVTYSVDVADRAAGADWRAQLAPVVLSETTLTEIFAVAVTERLPGAAVQLLEPLSVNVEHRGRTLLVSLGNTYRQGREDPDLRIEAVEIQLDNLEQLIAEGESGWSPVELEHVVPVVKGELFLEEISQPGAAKIYHEPYVADLVIAYAEDSPTRLRFLLPDEVESLGLAPAELRRRAVENLLRILPPLRRDGEAPVFMVVADGNFEASILLVDEFWEAQATAVPGDLVAAVPARDILIFTGTAVPEGVDVLERAVRAVHDQGAYLVTERLLVRRNGAWTPYEP